ncbi:M28 family peptidase [bacterium]|nr:M28 family peptidase [bacterium]
MKFLSSAALLMLMISLPFAAKAQPFPFPADPAILALADQVSADSLEASIDQLVSFHTRHTYSDTLSETTGVGAARNWVRDEYARHGLDDELFPWMGNWDGSPHLCYNVTGTYGGSGEVERYLILGGHLDSRTVSSSDVTGFAPGADDDGSGVAAMIEIGRLLANLELGPTIIQSAFTGEEQGLLGSSAMAEAFAADSRNVTGMLSMDMLAHTVFPDGTIDTSTVRIFSAGPQGSSSRQLARYAKWVGEAYADGLTVTLIPAEDRPGRGGDHSSFSDAGFPAIRVIETGEDTDFQHDDTDLPEAMDFNYFRKNVRLVLGVTATIAQAPPAPEPPQVVNMADGESIQVSWPSGYVPTGGTSYVAVRYTDETHWDQMVEGENDRDIALSGFIEGDEIAISMSVTDVNGLPSPFSDEVFITVSSTIDPPSNFRGTSGFNSVLLRWTPVQIPTVSHYDLERAEPGGDFTIIHEIEPDDSSRFEWDMPQGQLFLYRMVTVLEDGRRSAPSKVVYGALIGHQGGMLVVDATSDGDGTPGSPQDDVVDDFFASILLNFNVAEIWDLADSVAIDRPLTDADLGLHQVVVIHADGLDNNFSENSEAIRQFIAHGGRLVLCGWRLSSSLGNSRNFSETFDEGTLFRDVFGIETSTVTAVSDPQFIGASGVEWRFPDETFPDVELNTDYYPTLPGALPIMDVLTLDNSGRSVPIYAFNAADGADSEYHGEISGIMDGQVQPGWVLFDFPLSAMTELSATNAITHALMTIGVEEVGVDEEDPSLMPVGYHIVDTWPNPFNPLVTITLSLPNAAHVTLSVTNLLGREVAVLHQGNMSSGLHAVSWDALGQASGPYFVRFEYPGSSEVRKVMLLR